MIKTTFRLLFISCIVAAMLQGCAKLTTTYSTFTVNTSDLERLEALVHSSLMEFGLEGGPIWVNREVQNVYRILGKPYQFYVAYKISNDHVVIQIENTKKGASDLQLIEVNEYLARITELIKKKLQDANLKATVETKSHWIPSLY